MTFLKTVDDLRVTETVITTTVLQIQRPLEVMAGATGILVTACSERKEKTLSRDGVRIVKMSFSASATPSLRFYRLFMNARWEMPLPVKLS